MIAASGVAISTLFAYVSTFGSPSAGSAQAVPFPESDPQLTTTAPPAVEGPLPGTSPTDGAVIPVAVPPVVQPVSPLSRYLPAGSWLRAALAAAPPTFLPPPVSPVTVVAVSNPSPRGGPQQPVTLPQLPGPPTPPVVIQPQPQPVPEQPPPPPPPPPVTTTTQPVPTTTTEPPHTETTQPTTQPTTVPTTTVPPQETTTETLPVTTTEPPVTTTAIVTSSPGPGTSDPATSTPGDTPTP